MTLTTSLVVTYISLITMLQILVQSKRITKQYNGWVTVLTTGGGVMSAVNGWTFNVYLHAGIAAWSAWAWWHGGGGDGTKRRLKSWARRFQGVRRTAPSAAS
jgi:hypothetical protein